MRRWTSWDQKQIRLKLVDLPTYLCDTRLQTFIRKPLVKRVCRCPSLAGFWLGIGSVFALRMCKPFAHSIGRGAWQGSWWQPCVPGITFVQLAPGMFFCTNLDSCISVTRLRFYAIWCRFNKWSGTIDPDNRVCWSACLRLACGRAVHLHTVCLTHSLGLHCPVHLGARHLPHVGVEHVWWQNQVDSHENHLTA